MHERVIFSPGMDIDHDAASNRKIARDDARTSFALYAKGFLLESWLHCERLNNEAKQMVKSRRLGDRGYVLAVEFELRCREP